MIRLAALPVICCTLFISASHAAEPRQRVVISDDYTSWLLKSADSEKYGEGEALPKLLAEGWTITSVSTSCQSKGHTVYVLSAPNAPGAGTAPKR
jgi:hypothetical protein